MITLFLAAAVATTPVATTKKKNAEEPWAEAYTALHLCSSNGGQIGKTECKGTYKGLEFHIYTDFSGSIKGPESKPKWSFGCGIDRIQASSVCYMTNHLRFYYVDGKLAFLDWNTVKAARIGSTPYPETSGRVGWGQTLQVLNTMHGSDSALLKVTDFVMGGTEFVDLDLRQFKDAEAFATALSMTAREWVDKRPTQ
jgi:hypothetical protein